MLPFRSGGHSNDVNPKRIFSDRLRNVLERARHRSAIDTLEGLDPALAELVNLKFFCGLNFAEVAAIRGISERTAQRDWEKARVLLQRALEGRDLLPG